MKKQRTQSFKDRVQMYPAKLIAKATGCKLPTAYEWRSGRRVPRANIQGYYLSLMERASGEVNQ